MEPRRDCASLRSAPQHRGCRSRPPQRLSLGETLASFQAHIAVGLSISGLAATGVMLAGMAEDTEVLLLFGLGALGSLLPDLDSDHSVPVQVSFSLASMLLAFVALFTAADWFPTLAELTIVWLTVYLLSRHLLFAALSRLTTHRGIFHSIPAALLFTGLAAALLQWIWQQPPESAWLGGFFVGGGYLVHLALDEIYKVNLFGARTRRNTSHALKLWYLKSPESSLAVYLALVLCYPALPATEPLLNWWNEQTAQTQAPSLLVPEDGWFRLAPPEDENASAKP